MIETTCQGLGIILNVHRCPCVCRNRDQLDWLTTHTKGGAMKEEGDGKCVRKYIKVVAVQEQEDSTRPNSILAAAQCSESEDTSQVSL